MSKFNSFLAQDIDNFIRYRKDIVYTYDRYKKFFTSFDRYVKEKDVNLNDITPTFFLEFRSSLSVEPETINREFIALRAFFDYLVRIERISVNPLIDISALKSKSYIPYVFSPQQIESLLQVIEKRIRSNSEAVYFTDLATYSIISLMARCGLRISEPLRLKDEHYRKDEKTIYIERTKFNKDRLLPLPESASIVIDNYLSVRNSIIKQQKFSYLFTTPQGIIKDHTIYKTFHSALKVLKIDHLRYQVGNITFGQPKPHTFRYPNLNKIQTFF
ncbi:integrase/recombinase XerD [Candidatus Magnetomorum sp. HK-1]|nr:integrase/recombinase XerD [Candidatus Magnetomorum sp. HK-1]